MVKYPELEHILEQQEAAVKGIAALGEWLVTSKCDDRKVIEAFHTIKDWMFDGDE